MRSEGDAPLPSAQSDSRSRLSRSRTGWPSTMSWRGTIGYDAGAGRLAVGVGGEGVGEAGEQALHDVLLLLGEVAAGAVGHPSRELG